MGQSPSSSTAVKHLGPPSQLTPGESREMGGANSTEAEAEKLADTSKNVLKKKFDQITVEKQKVARAEHALNKVAMTNYDENLIRDINTGLAEKDFDSFFDAVVKGLHLPGNSQLEFRSKLEQIKFASQGKRSCVEGVKIDLDGFS